MTDGAVKATIITDTYDILYDILSGVTDPLSRAQAKFIKSSFPNPNEHVSCKAAGWQYPLVIIEGANIEREPLSVDRVQTRTRETVVTEIEVHARTSLERDQIAEDVLNILYTNASSLSTGTLQNISLLGTTNDVDFLGRTKVRIKRMTVQFMRVD